MRCLARAAARLALRGDVEIVLPVHRSPAVSETVHALLGDTPCVRLLPPVDYVTFVRLMRSAYLVVTDSGGVQEEAPALNVPVLVMRDTTERPEGLEAGCARLSGTDPAGVAADIDELLDDEGRWLEMAMAPNPYGDGRAAERIVDRMLADLQVAPDVHGAALA